MRYFNAGNRLVAMLATVIGVIVFQHNTVSGKCPCDIYAAGGTPCVAAHSTVRALYSSYNGPLYQIKRTSDNQTKDIGVLDTGGFANAATQDAFLNGQPGTISKIYDQSPNANHLIRTPAGGWLKVPGKEANAGDAKIMANGHLAYGVKIIGNGFSSNPGMGYRNDSTRGVVTGNGAEGMYMVCSGKHYNQWCCFDYGNVQTNNTDNGNATMETIYFGSSIQWGHGSGSGPWVMNDCENGIQAGVDPAAGAVKGVWAGNTTISADYVTGVVKSTTENFFAIRGGDANTGKLKTMYSGRQYPGWYPKKLEGAIALGVGGDNSNTGDGTFFEGAMTKGCPSDTTEDSVQANIIAAGYGKTTLPPVSALNGIQRVFSTSKLKVHYNPLTADALISYILQNTRRVSINIFDQRGRRIASVVNGVFGAGGHEAVWNAKRVPAGVYVWIIAIDGRDGWTGKIVIGR